MKKALILTLIVSVFAFAAIGCTVPVSNTPADPVDDVNDASLPGLTEDPELASENVASSTDIILQNGNCRVAVDTEKMSLSINFTQNACVGGQAQIVFPSAEEAAETAESMTPFGFTLVSVEGNCAQYELGETAIETYSASGPSAVFEIYTENYGAENTYLA